MGPDGGRQHQGRAERDRAAALPVFRAQRSGHFIHTASTAAYKVVPGQAVYAATKAAVKVLTEGLRQEAGPNLRVTLISPGFTDTEGVGKGIRHRAARVGRCRRDRRAAHRAGLTRGRDQPEIIASAIMLALALGGVISSMMQTLVAPIISQFSALLHTVPSTAT